MNKMILTHNSIPSAKVLRNALVSLGYPKILVTKNNNKNILFRYGSSVPANCSNEINPPEFIKLMANKERFSNFCQNNKITAPIFTKLKNSLPESFPILVRNTLVGMGSEGIFPISSLDELCTMDTNWYWVPYYNLTREYRVHVVNETIVKGFCKKFSGKINKEGIIIRNNENSKFSLIDINDEDKYKKLRGVTSNLINAFAKKFKDNVLFFALDIGWGNNEKEYIILEGNSAPGLNEDTAIMYAEILGPILFEK